MSGEWIMTKKRVRDDDASTVDYEYDKAQPMKSLYKDRRYPMYYDKDDLDQMDEEELRKFALDMLKEYKLLEKWVAVKG